MQERQTSRLIRPYVLPVGEEQPADPSRPASAGAVAHRSSDEVAWPPESARGRGTQPVPWHRPAGTIGRSRRGRTARLTAIRLRRRTWIIAASTACLLVGALVAIVAKNSYDSRGGGTLTAEQTLDVSPWFVPGLDGPPPPGSQEPLPTAERLPVVPVGDPPPGSGGTLPDGGGAAATPGRPRTVAPPPAVPGAPGAPAAPKPGAPAAPRPQNSTAYSTIQGESYDDQSGVLIEDNEKTGGKHAGFISNGDWVRYDNVGFTDSPAVTLLLSASNAARQNRTGRVELRLDRRSNAPIASMTIPNNGDWFAFTTYRLAIPPTTGTHTVYLTFPSSQDEEFANLDWLSFRR